MLATAGSLVKPMKPNSISDPDWGNRIALGSMEEANCCIEFNNQFGFVVRAVKDIEVDETLILYDKTCSAMASDEHIEARKEWLMGEKTMAQMDNAAYAYLDDLAKRDKFSDLYMVLESTKYRIRGLELMLAVYNQLVGIYRRDVEAERIVKKAHAEAVDCCVNMFYVEYARVVTEVQEINAGKVQNAVESEQLLMDEHTQQQQQIDDFFSDTSTGDEGRENILTSLSKFSGLRSDMTITEAMKSYQQARSLPPELPATATSGNVDTDGADIMQMFAQVVYAHGIIISDERNNLPDVDFSKYIVMPRNIKNTDFHPGYSTHQSITAKKKKYLKLLQKLETNAVLQATDPSPEEQAESVVRVTDSIQELKECWTDIITGPDVRTSPRRQSQTTSSSGMSMLVGMGDEDKEVTTDMVNIKQESKTNIARKPEKYTDVLADVIDMTMDVPRIPLKPKRSKAGSEAWKLPQCLWDQAKAPVSSPHINLPQNPWQILNAKLQQKPIFNWTRYGHQSISGDGNCLFNCLSFMLKGHEDIAVAKQLRRDVSAFINKLRGFTKCTTDGTFTGNITMRMAVHISKQPKLEQYFLQRVGPIIDDTKLNEWRLHHHVINFETGEINTPFFSRLIAKSVVETYSARVAEWRTSATDLGDDTLPLQVMAHMYDVGFIVWRNATFDPEDDIKVKFDQFIYRTVEHHGRIGFPVLNILYSPPGTVYENFILNIGHYSILTDKFSYFSHFGDDGVITSFPDITTYVWNPTKTVHDIRDSNDYAVLRVRRSLLLYQHNGDVSVWDRYWWINCARRKVSALLLAEQDEEASTLLQQVVALEQDATMPLPTEPVFAPLPPA